MKKTEIVRSELRVVAGTLRGRKVTTHVHEGLRPTPQRVRESLFSILGNAVPQRAFFDVFAGSGIVGLEAISRGASEARFIEGDAKAAAAIQKYAEQWGVAKQVTVLKADAYRWAERWLPKPEPVTVFLSPPFPDLEPAKLPGFLALVQVLKEKLPPDSVLTLQTEDNFDPAGLPEPEKWDVRTYGRNRLMFFVRDVLETPVEEPPK